MIFIYNYMFYIITYYLIMSVVFMEYRKIHTHLYVCMFYVIFKFLFLKLFIVIKLSLIYQLCYENNFLKIYDLFSW